MFLAPSDQQTLETFRRRLHARPELSGEERETARAVAEFLTPTKPDVTVENLGGHGLAFAYSGAEPGPTLLFRADLDGLPIQERSRAPHASQIPGRAHACGHDGHMTALAALGLGLARERPKRGRAVLLFQPAEETGAGAAAVIADPQFAPLKPDFAFGWHNMPGLPFGRASLRSGPVNCASRGLRATLSGKTAHASMPEFGVSPLRALAALLPGLTALGRGGALDEGYSLVTVTHASMGERAFGVAPGGAEIFATLRTLTDATMAALVERAEALIEAAAKADGLGVEIAYEDVFAHCENSARAVVLLAAALDAEGVLWGEEGLPMRGSEDFGRFRAVCPSAMFLLGAGETCPSLHNPDYDFPDALAFIAARVMMRAAREALG